MYEVIIGTILNLIHGGFSAFFRCLFFGLLWLVVHMILALLLLFLEDSLLWQFLWIISCIVAVIIWNLLIEKPDKML